MEKRTEALTDPEIDRSFEEQIKHYEVEHRQVRALIKRLKFIQFPNDYTVPSPFRIYAKGKLPPRSQIVRRTTAFGDYDKVKLYVRGPALDTLAETVCNGVLKLCQAHRRCAFITTFPDLFRAMHVADSSAERRCVWDRLVRLKEQAWILRVKGSKAECDYGMLDMVARDSDERLLIVANPLYVYQQQETGWTWHDTDFRAKLSGDTAKSIYRVYDRYYSSKEPCKTFKMGRLKLVRYLNIDPPTQYAPSQVWHHMLRRGFEELKQHEYFSSYRWNPTTDVITVRYKKQERPLPDDNDDADEVPAAVTETKATPEYGDIVADLQRTFTAAKWKAVDGSRLVAALRRAEEWLAPYAVTLGGFMHGYATWLEDQNLQYMQATLFNPDNGYFKRYAADAGLQTREEAEAKRKREEEEKERRHQYELENTNEFGEWCGPGTGKRW
jgi:hypothetical protein